MMVRTGCHPLACDCCCQAASLVSVHHANSNRPAATEAGCAGHHDAKHAEHVRPADYEANAGKGRLCILNIAVADAEGQFHRTMPVGQTHAYTNPSVQSAVLAEARLHMPSKAS